jgi:4a-hydroxytetrahydrobiopterin dehydratase
MAMVNEGGAQCDLASRDCVPCQGGVPPLRGEELEELTRQLGGAWNVVEGHHLEKEFTFDDFSGALAFANKVGELAESVGHHPDIYLTWGVCRVTIWTHKINGLADADFVFAAKVDALR